MNWKLQNGDHYFISDDNGNVLMMIFPEKAIIKNCKLEEMINKTTIQTFSSRIIKNG